MRFQFKSIPLFVALALFFTSLIPALHAQAPTDSQRIADLERYIKNEALGTEWHSALAGQPGPGHNAWMMVSTALVIFMTLPGLALFYGGLVRKKNVLSVVAQCLGLTALVTLIWWAVGYSLVFAPGNGFIGGLKYAFFAGVDYQPNTDYAPWVSHNIFAMYQLAFAIITPALIVGAIAERMKFSALMVFSVLWMFLVYFPSAHMLWGIDGAMNGLWNDAAKVKGIDFAGGIVVHMTSGWSALILCILLGARRGFGREQMPPHNMVLCMVGTGMLWVGWYGFNAGSALGADRIATTAFVSTTLSAAVGCFVWGALEWITRGKPSVLGLCSGAVAGLATVTPASGFVGSTAAVIIGLVAGLTTFFACAKLKAALGYDDSLDTFGVHAVGGTFGTIMAGIFASSAANPNLDAARIKDCVGHGLWLEQLKAGGVVLVLSVVGTVVLFYVVKAMMRTRVDPEVEHAGLDVSEHGEEGYIL